MDQAPRCHIRRRVMWAAAGTWLAWILAGLLPDRRLLDHAEQVATALGVLFAVQAGWLMGHGRHWCRHE